MDKLFLTWNDCSNLAVPIVRAFRGGSAQRTGTSVYAVPRGGYYAALIVKNCAEAQSSRFRFHSIDFTDDPAKADAIVDDIVDSGKTRSNYEKYGKPFYALFDRTKDQAGDKRWVVFPWEAETAEQHGPAENIVRLIEYIGDDPNREGLRETPKRVIDSYSELFAGYAFKDDDIATMLKTFEDGHCDEMVIQKDIEFTSFCEHHMLPFTGVAHVGYIPDGRIVGLSKMARLVDVFAKRLQVQERMTEQIAVALMSHLQPKGAACVVEARHSCMSCRGVHKQGSSTITSSMLGVFREKPAARAEFLQLIRG